MRPIRSSTFVLIGLLLAAESRAAGLIHDVPADGTAVLFDFQQTGTVMLPGEDHSISGQGTLRVAVVGTQEIAGLQCRWIEIELRQTGKIGDASRSVFRFWKVLVPQQGLMAGGDLASTAFKIYTADDMEASAPRLVSTKEARRVVLKDLREFLPPAPTKENRVNAVVTSKRVTTPAGEFDCDCHVFDGYGDLYLGGPARQQSCAVYRVWTHKQSPTGVVAMEVQSHVQSVTVPLRGYAEEDYQLRGAAIRTVSTMKFARSEEGAAGRFPDHQ